ncbi:E3 ubiquitin-protein ligase IPI1-like [Magnolia sinica]|uniref:E3 ubiquitin-protein ligase IPI1-like n=1 Tax=Magnolia sinica TaxID=86752 RepID=UPI002658996B|nr:E3 ubiquitin-protein ligase IPI1-like [Magnolia sinica]
MGLGKTDLSDDRGGAGGDKRLSFVASSSVFCSICLEAVTNNGDRSTAKLQCGHEFHLDCIGSAFNAKGQMQCPNCRKVEKGQWLYANGYRSFPESSMDDWTHDEDLYDLSYSEVPFDIHWCPFGLTRLTSSFEDGESPPNPYNDLLGHHAIFAEHIAASSAAAHSCPYISYFQSIQPLPSANSSESVDGPSFHQPWSGLSGPSDIPNSQAFPATDFHYQNWEQHSSPFPPTSSRTDGADHSSSSAVLRSTRPDLDGLLRAGPFVPPFLHGSASRAGGSVISSMVPPPYLGNSRPPARVHGFHSYHQQPNLSGVRGPIFSGGRRSGGPRGLAPAGPAPSSSSDQAGLYFFPSSGSSVPNLQEADNHFYAWERDRFAPYPLVPVDRESSLWGPFHQATTGGSDSINRTGFRHRHGSERPLSHGQTETSPYQHDLPRTHPFI